MPYKTTCETSVVTGGTRGRSLAEPRRPCREWTYPARQSAMRQGCLTAVMSVRQAGGSRRRGARGLTPCQNLGEPVRKTLSDCPCIRKQLSRSFPHLLV